MEKQTDFCLLKHAPEVITSQPPVIYYFQLLPTDLSSVILQFYLVIYTTVARCQETTR